MRLSRDHHDALEAHVDTIMRRANRWALIAAVLYGALLSYGCWMLS